MKTNNISFSQDGTIKKASNVETAENSYNESFISKVLLKSNMNITVAIKKIMNIISENNLIL